MRQKKKVFKYQHIYDTLAAEIRAGHLEALPSEEMLSQNFQAGRNIVRQALQMLAEDGYIIKQRGKHTMVSRGKTDALMKDAKLVLFQRHNYLGAANNPVYTAIISEILELSAAHGWDPDILYLPPNENPEYKKYVMEKLESADGIFLTSISCSEAAPEIREILQKHPNTVCVDHNVGIFGKYQVATDNYAGGVLAAQKVIAKGKKHPFIYGCADSFYSYLPMIERAMGFRDECSLAFGNFDREKQFALDNVMPEYHTIYNSVKRIIAENPETDTIFALTDMSASYVISALSHIGKRVPEDIGVIGFDGIINQGVYKNLTSIRQNVEDTAKQSCMIMEKLLRHEPVTGAIVFTKPVVKEGKSL